MGAGIELRGYAVSRSCTETCKVTHIPIQRKPTHFTKTSGSEGKTSIVMANTGQEIMKRKNKKKALTLDNFYTQNTEETGEEMKEGNTKLAPPKMKIGHNLLKSSNLRSGERWKRIG